MIDQSPPLPNGILSDWSRDRYDADTERVRSTSLKVTVTEPQGMRAYYRAVVDPPEAESFDANDEYQPKVDAFVMGHLFHSLTLEGERNWIASPHKRGSAKWKSLRARTQRHLWLVSESQDRELRDWERALNENPQAVELIGDGGFPEQVILWDEQVEFTDAGGNPQTMTIPCKAAIDRLNWNDTSLACIKTTRATNREEFEREVERLRYDFSAAFYHRGRVSVPQFAGTRTTFKWIVILKSSPAYCYVWEVSEAWLNIGNEAVKESLKRLARCRHDHNIAVADGRDPIEAWPDDLARTELDCVMPTHRAMANAGWKEYVN